mmetsp:Transcript_22065/g.28568  ORF Transcript_22065/g.28568 Transcript_22065/m.28568 type:complete len:170 (-) Transcript_22065:274-783(-)
MSQALYPAFELACRNNQVAKAIEILEHEQIDVNHVNKYGSSPLILACIPGNIEIIKILLKYGADINIQGPEDWTPLHCATFYGHVDVTMTLLESGAKKNMKNKTGCVPGLTFHTTCSNDTINEIQQLLAFDIDVSSCDAEVDHEGACDSVETSLIKRLFSCHLFGTGTP